MPLNLVQISTQFRQRLPRLLPQRLASAIALGAFLAFTGQPQTAAADDTADTSVQKLTKITELFRHEAYQESPSDLTQAGSQELRRELERQGLDTSFLSNQRSLEGQLREACQRYPQLVGDGTLLSACTRGMAQKLDDPYAAYLNPSTFKGLMSRFGGTEVAGPGVAVIKDHPGDAAEVLEANPGTAAAQAHLLPGDHLLDIDGHTTTNLSIDDVRGRLAGAEGSTLEVTVQRAGSTTPEHLSLTRAKLDTHTVESHMMSYQNQDWGYIRIRSFGSQTPVELKNALANLHGAHGLMLDLRNNGGGLVLSAVGVCSQFLPEGSTVVSVNGRFRSEVHTALKGPRASLPLVVLINQNSASSAEITAGALHDMRMARLVGTRSFGKGTVQRFLPLGDGSALKVTTAHYRTPAGSEIHHVGIVPDVVVNEPGLGMATDIQLQRALGVLASEPTVPASRPTGYNIPDQASTAGSAEN